MSRFPKLLTGLFRDFRNSYNEGVDKIDSELDLQKKRVDDLIKGTPQPSEVVDARGGHPILRDRLNQVDAHLAQSAINVASFGVVADGITDNAQTFQNALNKAVLNKNSRIFFPNPNGVYVINGDFTIPKNINLISNGAVIRFNGQITLEGNNTINGIVFDVNWNSKGFKVIGGGCFITNNTFKNFKRTDVVQLNVIELSNITHAVISENIFDGVKPNVDDISIANGSIARAIKIYNSHDIIIESNVFKNMDGLADSDYIHVHNSVVSDTSYPFTTGYVAGYFDYCNGVIIRNNIFYHHNAKSDIKVQASGVIVEHNTIYIDPNLVGQAAQPIRAYSNRDSVISDNRIVIKSPNVSGAITLQTSVNCYVERNTIECEVESSQDYNLLYIVDGINLHISENKGRVFAKGNVLYLSGVQDSFIKENDFLILESSVNVVHPLYIKNSSGGEPSRNTMIKGNTFRGKSNNISFKYTHEGKVENITLKENEFVGSLLTMTLNYADGLALLQNIFEVPTVYFITIPSGGGVFRNIKLIDNYFDIKGYSTGKYTIVRSYMPTTKVVFSGNDLAIVPTEYGVIYNTSTNYNPLEVSYLQGNVKSSDYDYGYQISKADFNKQRGHMFFERNVNKPYFWDGSLWKDASGVTYQGV